VRGYECHAEAIRFRRPGDRRRASHVYGRRIEEVERQGAAVSAALDGADARPGESAAQRSLAWVVVMAGYAPTPAEEVDGNGNATARHRFAHGVQADAPEERVKEALLRDQATPHMAELRARYHGRRQRSQESQRPHPWRARTAFVNAKDARKKELPMTLPATISNACRERELWAKLRCGYGTASRAADVIATTKKGESAAAPATAQS
jgi:hypothetical protein